MAPKGVWTQPELRWISPLAIHLCTIEHNCYILENDLLTWNMGEFIRLIFNSKKSLNPRNDEGESLCYVKRFVGTILFNPHNSFIM